MTAQLMDAQGRPTEIWKERITDGGTRARMYVLPPGYDCMQGRTKTFRTKEEAQNVCNTALQILAVPGVERVVLSSHPADERDTITVNAQSDDFWEKWGRNIEGKIILFVKSAGAPPEKRLISESHLEPTKRMGALVEEFEKAGEPGDIAEIKAVISLVNEELAAHGGEASFWHYDKDRCRLFVSMHGNCEGCVGSQRTIIGGLMRYYTMLADTMQAPVQDIRILQPTKSQNRAPTHTVK